MKKIFSLNGQWRFLPELEDRPWNNQNKGADGMPLYASPKLNESGWETMVVPGVWECAAEKYKIYEGVCWYRTTFSADEGVFADAARLWFGGVNSVCTVYLNGKEIGTHLSGYTAFSIDVTGKITAGENHLAVRVDNRAMMTKWPCDWGYFNYGGIHRDVTLELCFGAYMQECSVVPVFEDGTARLHLTGKLVNAQTLTVAIGEDRRELPAAADGSFQTAVEFPKLAAWTPEQPNLYEASIVCGDTTETYRLGFKKLAAVGTALTLNGAPYQLHGICYVYDSPKYGLVMDEEQLRTDLSLMQEMGINAIRTHYPMDDRFYRLCDEMGFLVWIEPNVYCYKPANDTVNTFFAQKSYVDAAVTMLREMIAEAKSHACVAIYGIGNECNTAHPEAKPFFDLLAAEAVRADNTRLRGFASLYGLVEEIAADIDVIGVNAYYGWYDKISSLYQDKEESPAIDLCNLHTLLDKLQGKPLLLTEFGADSIPGCFSEKRKLWSEEYHADIVGAIIKEVSGKIAGTFPFCFSDYLDPSKVNNGFWNGFNLKGAVTFERKKKLAFAAIREAYRRLR